MNELLEYLRSLPYEDCFYVFKCDRKFSLTKFITIETDKYDRMVMEEICSHLTEMGCKMGVIETKFNENMSEINSLVVEGDLTELTLKK